MSGGLVGRSDMTWHTRAQNVFDRLVVPAQPRCRMVMSYDRFTGRGVQLTMLGASTWGSRLVRQCALVLVRRRLTDTLLSPSSLQAASDNEIMWFLYSIFLTLWYLFLFANWSCCAYLLSLKPCCFKWILTNCNFYCVGLYLLKSSKRVLVIRCNWSCMA